MNRKPMSWKQMLLFVLAALTMSGCMSKWYEWSPDGKWLAIVCGDGLRLADVNGKLQGFFVPGVSRATWFPDSQRLLVAREIDPGTWSDLAGYLTPRQLADVTEAAGHVRDLALLYNWVAEGANSWDKFKARLTDQETQAGRPTQIYADMGSAIALYFRDHADDSVRQTIPADRWNELQKTTQAVYVAQIYSLSSVGAQEGPKLLTGLHHIDELRVSPTGKAAMIVVDKDTQDVSVCDLWAASTDGAGLIEVSDKAACFPDWSLDGHQVAFIHAAMPNARDGGLGSLSRATVCDENGLLEKSAKQEDLAGLMFSGMSSTRWLPDGRIVFCSAAVTLPCTPSDMPNKGELFSITPGKEATVSRLLPRQAVEEIGDQAGFFEISPDGLHASIPGQDGIVTVIDLSTGAVKKVQGVEFPHDNTFIGAPAWRNNDELTFAAPGAGGIPSIMLWSLATGKAHSLSADWPPGTIQAPPSTQPTSQPAAK